MRRRYLVTTLVCTAALAAACGGSADDSAPLPLLDPAAKGTLSEHGGATRAGDDRSSLIAESIKNSGAKNVILLIGDGMGDSEITVARNYEHGAGGAFPGLDALPLTGAVHPLLAEQGRQADYVTDSAASGTGLGDRHQDVQRRDLGDIHGKAAVRHCSRLAKEAGWPPATSPPPRSRTRPRPSRSRTSPSATATDPTRPAAVPDATPWRRAAPARSPSSCSTTRADVVLGGGAKTFHQVAKAGEYQGKTLLKSRPRSAASTS